MEMGFSGSTRTVFDRIQKLEHSLEPENAKKIIGYLLLQGQKMDNLALSPDVVLQEVVHKAKAGVCQFQQLAPMLSSSPVSMSMNDDPGSQFAPFSPVSYRPFLSPHPYLEPQVAAKHHSSDFLPIGYPNFAPELPQFSSAKDQVEPVNLESVGFIGDHLHSDAALGDLGPRAGRRNWSQNEFPVKPCNFFNKGFCKKGSNCRYFHGQGSERFPQMFDCINDNQGFSSGSLKKLELEIIELLKSRKGNPVPTASLPMIYHYKYGKVLQAEGHLTESQRHGKAGYSLTKLLERMKHGIRLIERPHGLHAVILAEDADKYMEGDEDELGPIVRGSRQIFLTFPAESTFTEDGVSNYFRAFGPVVDVSLTCLPRRTFGFVTFLSADTAEMVLAKGNPHFICGDRVRVKPYRKKTKLVDRKYHEKIEAMMHHSPHNLGMEDELHSVPRGDETLMPSRKRLKEKQENALELDRKPLANLQIPRNPMGDESYYACPLDGLKVTEDESDSPSPERFRQLLDDLGIGSSDDDKIRHTQNNFTDQDSQ